MVLLTIVTGAYKPTNITGGPTIVPMLLGVGFDPNPMIGLGRIIRAYLERTELT
jgi:hypothetical protein